VLEGSIINIGNESSPPIALHMIVKNGVTGELLFTKTKVPTPDGLSPEQSTRFEIPFTSDEVRFYVPENSQKFSKIVSTHPVFTIDVYSIHCSQMELNDNQNNSWHYNCSIQVIIIGAGIAWFLSNMASV
jgi:hypothetical protein